jgi:RNA polymerase sigma-54 factor
MKITQSQRLEHRQIISQRLQQSLRLLTLNNLELEDAIEQELETNPLLEWEPTSSPDENLKMSPAERVENVDWQEYFENASSDSYFYESGDEVDLLAMAPYPPVTLAEYLIRQLEVSGFSDRDIELAIAVVSALDQDGYLRVSVESVAEEMGVKTDEAERVLTEIVQKLEPRGVGARDLREALLLQLNDAGEEAPPLANVLIEDYLDDTATKSPAELAAKLKVARAEVEEAISFIKSLEPRPGRDFGAEVNPSLIPDVRIELVGEEVEISLLDDRVGRLYISPRYRALLAGDGEADDETISFLKNRLTAAALFIRALHQRRRTLEKVVAAIFERQRDFLLVGEPGLKPLTMEEVAEQVGFHVSTVSRAVAGKAADTPRGVFLLKYFFTGRVSASDGDVSVKRAKVVLEDIIDDEDKSSPLSDEELTAELSKRGIRVARRTVAKYRRELDIPGKHARKKNL